MVDIMKYNDTKIEELKGKIKTSNGNYHLYCFDVDDVVFNVAGLMQEIIGRIDYRATEEYRNSAKTKYTTSKDIEYIDKLSFKILNAILEETKCTIESEKGFRLVKEYLDFSKPIIDYEELYLDKNLYEYAIEFIKNMITMQGENDFFIFISHRNPEREGIIKTRRLYELVPEIDAVLTLPFHKEAGCSEMNSKSAFIQETLELPYLDNCILIDNSRLNCIDWRRNGGTDIRYLPDGFNDDHTLYDYMSKLDNLDPYMINFILTLIKYSRENPEYTEELEKVKVKKL